jgi:VWFA-related protein
MRRALIAVSFWLTVACAAAAASPSPAPSPTPAPSPAPPTFTAEVEQVLVDAVVTDKKGVSIPGLKREDFSINEDGKPQPVVSFEAVQLPDQPSATPPPRPRVSRNDSPEARTARAFIVLFDDVHLTPFQARRARSAVVEFLNSGVREGDRVTIVATGGGAWWSARMESGRDELLRLVKRLDGRLILDASPERMTDYEAMRVHTFGDPEVEARVRRRFETRGVAPRSAQDEGLGSMGDPLVRGRASEVYFQAVSRNRITLEILERVLLSLDDVRGRKSLILVSQGFIYDPNLDEFKRVVQASRRANVAIYFLDTRGLSDMPDGFSAEFGPAIPDQDIGAAFTESFEAAAGSESISADSGGFSVRNTNDLAKGLKRIADESRTYYLLGYNPTNVQRDGRFRKIEVKAGRPGLKVRARKGYYAPLEGKSALDQKRKDNVDPDIQAALDSPYEKQEIPLRMTAFVGDETLLGKANVIVATEVDVREFAFEQKEGRAHGSLEFLLITAHRESGEYFRYDQQIDMKLLPETRERLHRQWFAVLRDFELAPGGYQAKIVVRDKQSGRIGTVVHEFEVPDLTQWRLSSLIMTDTLQPAPKDAPPGAPKPQLVVRRDFPQGATLYCSYELYGAAKDPQTHMPRVVADYQVRKADGSLVVAQVDPTPIRPTSLGRLSRLTGTPLQGAPPGDYELVVNLKDEIAGKTMEAREPFRIVAE